MKIGLTGGGTGGHVYPIIAVSEALNMLARENHIADMELYFFSPTPYNPSLLYNQKLIYRAVTAGKVRRYFSILNFFDLFKTGWGVLKATWSIFLLYPDVMFGKGGYASFPALCAARILRIPVVIHESDSTPGKVNAWAGTFAKRIAVSYPDAAAFFPPDRVAFTGSPIRKELLMPLTSNAHSFLKLDPSIPTILVLGGSLGSRTLNDVMTEALPKLLEHYQVIHQTGKHNINEVKKVSDAVLYQSLHRDRYHVYDYLDDLTLRHAAGAANIVISRAGSALFEIAAWGLPSIIIPIPQEVSHDQTKNAFAYARSGAAQVIEENNLTGNILIAEIQRILGSPELITSMKEATKQFVKPDAARLIAEEIMKIALTHGEKEKDV